MWQVKLNPNPGSSRYLLSTIPQVIAAVFIITVAIMQMPGGLTPKDFVLRPEFIVTAIVSLLTIGSTFLILYFDGFCKWTAIALSFSIWNLLVIGWFIFRIVPAQSAGKLIKPEQEPILETETIDGLRDKAIEGLRLNVRSIACKIIQEITRRAKKELKRKEPDELNLGRLCEIIHTIAINTNNRFSEVWRTAIESLIAINAIVRGKRLQDLIFSTNSFLTSFPVVHGRTGDEEWTLIRDHFFRYFHEDLFSDLDAPAETKRIELERAKSHEEIDSLSAMSSLLLAASATRKKGLEEAFKKWCEVQDKILEEFTKAMEEPKLRERYTPPNVFVLVFHVLTDGIRLFHKAKDSDYLDSLDEKLKEFAEVALKDFERSLKPIEALNYLLAISKGDIRSLKYSVKTTEILRKKISNWPEEQILQFERRIHRKLNEAN